VLVAMEGDISMDSLRGMCVEERTAQQYRW
jgi:hypothetical protein